MTTIRKALVRVLLALVRWIAVPDPPAPVNPLAARVAVLVREAASVAASGEYKKWQIVAAQLIKEFPQEKRRDLNLLIELAVQALHAGVR